MHKFGVNDSRGNLADQELPTLTIWLQHPAALSVTSHPVVGRSVAGSFAAASKRSSAAAAAPSSFTMDVRRRAESERAQLGGRRSAGSGPHSLLRAAEGGLLSPFLHPQLLALGDSTLHYVGPLIHLMKNGLKLQLQMVFWSKQDSQSRSVRGWERAKCNGASTLCRDTSI